MTREEKSKLLNELLENEEKNDIGVLTRAERREFQQWISKALEQEPTTKSETLISLDVYKQVAKERDIAIQQLHELGYEFGQKIEPTAKNDLGVDCISRADVDSVIEQMRVKLKDGRMYILAEVVQDIIRELPSVTPQEPKTGHWIRISPAEIYECSECGQNVMTSDICAYKFCHGCSARMIEPQESEE